MVNITIYSKKGCRLCEVAMQKLLEIQKIYPFSLTEIDIENNDELFQKYKYLIPVIEIEGNEVFTYKIDEKRLEEILRLSFPLQ
ncbi:MAG: glutaredoxin family protein [Candidatus Methanoperedens sp.]|jgi:glutaredoxin|nr:glutaredoxin family protein [Candidatus Methanoperedens sp.]PKL54042.1 MAG: hypothetical protein CVV36_03590 [Candidatus Methanoperedenaceae archaeon HGW-Methanoperedenaceae-1]